MSQQSISLKEFPSFWLKLFPEFRESEKYDEENIEIPYAFLADYSRFFMDRLKSGGETDIVVQRTFNIMNKIFNDPSAEPEVINLIQIELCEILASSKKGLELANKLLEGDSVKYLKMACNWLNSVDD